MIKHRFFCSIEYIVQPTLGSPQFIDIIMLNPVHRLLVRQAYASITILIHLVQYTGQRRVLSQYLNRL